MLDPKCPVPSSIPVRVVFTCDDSRTYVCDLGTVDVTFEDLSLPLPVSRPEKLFSFILVLHVLRPCNFVCDGIKPQQLFITHMLFFSNIGKMCGKGLFKPNVAHNMGLQEFPCASWMR